MDDMTSTKPIATQVEDAVAFEKDVYWARRRRDDRARTERSQARAEVQTHTVEIVDGEETIKPLYSERQLKAATDFASDPRNGLRRRVGEPGFIERLALTVPMTKRERRKFNLRPNLTRGDNLQVEANPQAIDAFLEQAQPETPQQLVVQIAQAGRYDPPLIPALGRRVARFMRNFQEGGRMPRHIREKAITLSAVAQCMQKAFPTVHAAAIAAG